MLVSNTAPKDNFNGNVTILMGMSQFYGMSDLIGNDFKISCDSKKLVKLEKISACDIDVAEVLSLYQATGYDLEKDEDLASVILPENSAISVMIGNRKFRKPKATDVDFVCDER